MTDEEKMKLARECAATIWKKWHPSDKLAMMVRDGLIDNNLTVQSALAAINALAPRLEEAEKLLLEVCDLQETFCGDGITTHVRLGSKCSKIRDFLKQGESS